MIKTTILLFLYFYCFSIQGQSRSASAVYDSVRIDLEMTGDSVHFTIRNRSKFRTLVFDNATPVTSINEKGKKKDNVPNTLLINYQTYVDPDFDVNVVVIGPKEKHKWSHHIPKNHKEGVSVVTQYFIAENIKNSLYEADQLEIIRRDIIKAASKGSLPASVFYDFCTELVIGFD